MFIKINGIEPQFKIYKMTESVDGKMYIGKTKRPLHERMRDHRNSKQHADKHFSNVGWNNVTVEIIDTANSDEELHQKESIRILEYYQSNRELLLNKNGYVMFQYVQSAILEGRSDVHQNDLGEQSIITGFDLFPDNRCFNCQRKIDEYSREIFKFIKYNRYIIKNVCGARKYVSKCVSKMKRNQLTNDEARTLIIAFLKDKPWRGKCEMNSQWNKSKRI
jgi:hypothetical protein